MVIAIIALLAAMLLPALKQAREKGRQAVCLSNEQQIGRACVMYMDDYGGYIYNGNGVPGVNIFGWSVYLQPYLPVHDVNTNPTWMCPSSHPPNDTWAVSGYPVGVPGDLRYAYGYAFNCELSYVFGSSPSLSQVNSPANKALLLEGAGPALFATWVENENDPWGRNPMYWHSAGMDLLFFDAHVQWLPRAVVKGDQNNLLDPQLP